MLTFLLSLLSFLEDALELADLSLHEPYFLLKILDMGGPTLRAGLLRFFLVGQPF